MLCNLILVFYIFIYNSPGGERLVPDLWWPSCVPGTLHPLTHAPSIPPTISPTPLDPRFSTPTTLKPPGPPLPEPTRPGLQIIYTKFG